MYAKSPLFILFSCNSWLIFLGTIQSYSRPSLFSEGAIQRKSLVSKELREPKTPVTGDVMYFNLLFKEVASFLSSLAVWHQGRCSGVTKESK